MCLDVQVAGLLVQLVGTILLAVYVILTHRIADATRANTIATRENTREQTTPRLSVLLLSWNPPGELHPLRLFRDDLHRGILVKNHTTYPAHARIRITVRLDDAELNVPGLRGRHDGTEAWQLQAADEVYSHFDFLEALPRPASIESLRGDPTPHQLAVTINMTWTRPGSREVLGDVTKRWVFHFRGERWVYEASVPAGTPPPTPKS